MSIAPGNNTTRGFPSVSALNPSSNGEPTQDELAEVAEEEDVLDGDMNEDQNHDLPPSSDSSTADNYRPPKLLMRNRPNAPPPLPIHTTQTPPAPPAETPPMPPPEFTPPPPPPQSDSNTPIPTAPNTSRVNPYLANKKHLDLAKGRKDTPGRVYEKDEPPQAPNPNLRHPSTRPPSPSTRLGAGTATGKKAAEDAVALVSHLPGTFRRRTAEQELEAFHKLFVGSTTLDAYDVGLKLGEGTFG